jgi:hypothetical protein
LVSHDLWLCYISVQQFCAVITVLSYDDVRYYSSLYTYHKTKV